MDSPSAAQYTPFSTRLFEAAFSTALYAVLAALAAIPCALVYNHRHAAALALATGGSSVGLWAFPIVILVAPLCAMSILRTSPGFTFTGTKTRLVTHSLNRAHALQGLLQAAIFPPALVTAYFALGTLGPLYVFVAGYVLSPLIDRKHRTLSEWVSGTYMISETPSASSHKRPPRVMLSAVLSDITKAQKKVYVISILLLIVATSIVTFATTH